MEIESPIKKTSLRIPPHSVEAEQSVIGALMLDNRALDRVIDYVSAEDFYREDFRLIFKSIIQLSERHQPFDVLTIAENLKEQKLLDRIGGEARLFEIAQSTPSAANAIAYAEIVRERSVLRQLISAGTDMIDNAFNLEGRESKDLLDIAERDVFKIAEQHLRGSGPVKISDIVNKTTDRIDTLFRSTDTLTGLSTGFSDFDHMTSGLQPGDLIIVAGRPSMGKTTFAMNMAEHAAIKGNKPVLVFSMEMSSEQLTMRMLSSLGRINQHKVRTGKLTDEDWPRITSAVTMLSEANMYIDDTPALTPGDIRARARRISREHNGLALVVIDYLQLMQLPKSRENRATEISEISRSLKAIAKELNVPLIALSQLNRSLEHRMDRRPVMSDLRESGSLEQDADVIAFIYRDEVYNEESPDKGIAEIIIRKQRNGPIGDFRLTFLGQFTRFENFAPNHATTGVFE